MIALSGLPQGNRAGWSSPAVSCRPSITFMFCSAWPDAPLTRLSVALSRIARSGVLPGCTAIRQAVGAAHVARRRQALERQHPRERLALVAALELGLQVLHIGARRQPDVDRGQDAAVHRHQVRREGHLDRLAGGLAQALLDLRRVAMAC